MKSNLWTVIIAVGIIGLIIFSIQWNAAQPTPALAPTTTTSQTSTAPTQLAISPTIISTSSPAKKTETPVPTLLVKSTATPMIYIIQSGDTPFAIAALHNISVDELMAANNITNPTALQIGQEIHIPASQSNETTVATTNTIQHQIEDGDTLFSLANQYGSMVDDILTHNPGLEPTSLQVGQPIIIPLTHPVQQTSASPTRPKPNFDELAPTPTGNDELSLEMINAINIERLNNGLLPLEANERLAFVALAHAQDMVGRNYFDHVTPDGKSLRDRLQAQGLEPYWVGENIQRNTQPLDQTVQAAVGWFMDSQPHRDNILHSNFTHIGVGVVEGPPGWYTFVLVFAQL